jgi:D-galactose 1-dehydrogenase
MGTIFDYQVAALNITEGFELAALCDLDGSKITKSAGIPFFTSLDRFLEQGLDAVLISVPVFQHFKVCSQVLTNGIDVLLEKPAAETREHFEALVEMSIANRAALTIAVHASFGPEVLWFEQHALQSALSDYGPVTAIRGHFYDPYIIDGQIKDHFVGLGGSWMDSGINGLSVLARLTDLHKIRFDRADRTSLTLMGVREEQCSAHFRFPVMDKDMTGWAMIDTNWTLGKNFKMTEVFFHQSGTSFVLHHSEQAVYHYFPDGNQKRIADLSKGRERLINHYHEMFKNYRSKHRKDRSNVNAMRKLHELFFKVYT